MRLTTEGRNTLTYLLQLEIPSDVYFDVDDAGNVNAQCNTQEKVRAFRSAFGGLWNKEYSKECEWWTYETKLTFVTAEYPVPLRQSITVRIYACTEAPPTCKAIEEEYVAEERVPVAWETQKVTKKRLRFECGEGV